jgi:hypothetical protein
MLNWNSNTNNNTIIHNTVIAETDDTSLRLAIEACAEKSINLLKENIQNDSLYLLFEWNPENSTLTIVVTDAEKKSDGPQSVICVFTGLHSGLKQLNSADYEWQVADHIESIKFWLHDYLTTCTAFFRYSLVAIFHSSNRSNTELL